MVSDHGGFTLRWRPMWKKCTPCIKDLQYDLIVDIAHMDEDLDHIVHNVLDIRKITDSEPIKLNPYFTESGFQEWKSNYNEWLMDRFARDHMKTVEK